MVAHCANPKCRAQLRHLHEGRLFTIAATKSAIALQPRNEYRWLCPSCCLYMTVTKDGRIAYFYHGSPTKEIA
jgi:hypothetical protein